MNYSRRFTPSLTIALLTGFLASAVMACAQNATSFEAVNPPVRTTLIIRNQNWYDVRLYVVSDAGALPVRIGTVDGASSTAIHLRGRALQEVRNRGTARFLIRPLGSRASYTTQSTLVHPGDEIQLTVASQLKFSTIRVMKRHAGTS
jgi:hypothetical protein